MGVTLRIEAPDWTLYEGEVTPSGHPVTLDSVWSAHEAIAWEDSGLDCIPGNTFISTLDDVVQAWQGSGSYSSPNIVSIEGIPAAAPRYWQLYINSIPANLGRGHPRIGDDDYLLAALADTPLLQSSVLHARASPPVVRPGEDVIVSVWTEGEGVKVPIGGARVAGQQTDLKGEVKLRFHSPAVKRLKATRLGFIRSATVVVTIKAECGEGLTVLR